MDKQTKRKQLEKTLKYIGCEYLKGDMSAEDHDYMKADIYKDLIKLDQGFRHMKGQMFKAKEVTLKEFWIEMLTGGERFDKKDLDVIRGTKIYDLTVEVHKNGRL